MSEVSDETLMSYIDGELDWADRRRVETAIRQQPELQERLRIFAATGLNLQRLYNQPMQEAVPERLLDFVLNAPLGEAPKGQKSVREKARITEGFLADLVASLMPGGFRPAVAYAFSAVFVFGVAGGLLTGTLGGRSSEGGGGAPVVGGGGAKEQGAGMVRYASGALVAEGELGRALETFETGDATSWSLGGGRAASFRIRFTFTDNRRQYCRQFEMTDEAGAGSAGVACRNEQGQWLVEHNITGVVKAPPGVVSPIPASGHPPLQAIDMIVDKMIVGDVLGREDEKARIKARWERPAAR